MRQTICLLIAALAFSVSVISVRAQEGERLLAAVPKGYGAGVERKAPVGTIRIMVPITETTDNWSEAVAIQIYTGMGNIAPSLYRSGVDRFFADSHCPGSVSSSVKDSIENGYSALTWFTQCARKSQTGKPEFIWTKAIQGRESLYVVQATYKFEPSAAVKDDLLHYLDGVRVCDTRLPDRPCR
jgi:hypothetical protein